MKDFAEMFSNAELRRLIAEHGFRPVVFAITEAEGAALAERLAAMFSRLDNCVFRRIRFEPPLAADPEC